MEATAQVLLPQGLPFSQLLCCFLFRMNAYKFPTSCCITLVLVNVISRPHRKLCFARATEDENVVSVLSALPLGTHKNLQINKLWTSLLFLLFVLAVLRLYFLRKYLPTANIRL